MPEVVPLLEPLLAEEAAILPLQNGVEAADQLAETVGRHHVLGGLCPRWWGAPARESLVHPVAVGLHPLIATASFD